MLVHEPWLHIAKDDSWGEGVTPVRVSRQGPAQVHFSQTFSELAQSHVLCKRKGNQDTEVEAALYTSVEENLR